MNDEAVQTPETAPEPPVIELPPETTPQPVTEPAGPPVEVISVDELIERLIQEDGEQDEPAGDELAEEQADVPIVDPDPVVVIVEEVVGNLIDVIGDLDRIEAHTRSMDKSLETIQMQVDILEQTVNHPALTTSFADYTVTEALLLFLLLAVFLSACARMLRGGLSWLRS